MQFDNKFFNFSLHQKVNSKLCGLLLVSWVIWVITMFFGQSVADIYKNTGDIKITREAIQNN